MATELCMVRVYSGEVPSIKSLDHVKNWICYTSTTRPIATKLTMWLTMEVTYYEKIGTMKSYNPLNS